MTNVNPTKNISVEIFGLHAPFSHQKILYRKTVPKCFYQFFLMPSIHTKVFVKTSHAHSLGDEKFDYLKKDGNQKEIAFELPRLKNIQLHIEFNFHFKNMVIWNAHFSLNMYYMWVLHFTFIALNCWISQQPLFNFGTENFNHVNSLFFLFHYCKQKGIYFHSECLKSLNWVIFGKWTSILCTI